MSFMLVSHSASDLQFASDEGHRFRFEVVMGSGARHLRAGEVNWCAGRQPANTAEVMAYASRFALVCAQDYGLM